MARDVKVTGDIGGFKGGQVLQTSDEIGRYYTLLLNEGADKPTTLSHKAIVSHVRDAFDNAANADKSDDDLEVEVIEALESLDPNAAHGRSDATGDAGVPSTPQDVASRNVEAFEMGRKLSANTFSVMEENWRAKLRGYTATLQLMDGLVADYGDDLYRFPVGGSSMEKHEGKQILVFRKNKDEFTRLPDRWQNLRADRYKIKNNKNRTENKTWYGDLFDSTPLGVSLNRRLEVLSLALGQTTRSDPSIPADVRAMDNDTLLEEQSTTKNHRTYLIGQLRKAVELARQIADVNDLPVAGCIVYRDGKGVVKSTSAPICVFDWKGIPDPKEPGKVVRTPTGQFPFSIQNFLNMDVDKARVNGGTRAALEATLKREGDGQNESEDDAEGLHLVIRNPKQFSAALGEMAYMADDPVFLGNVLAACVGDDDMIKSLFKTQAGIIDWLCSKPELQQRFKALKEAEAKAAMLEKQAKEKRLATAG